MEGFFKDAAELDETCPGTNGFSSWVGCEVAWQSRRAGKIYKG